MRNLDITDFAGEQGVIIISPHAHLIHKIG